MGVKRCARQDAFETSWSIPQEVGCLASRRSTTAFIGTRNLGSFGCGIIAITNFFGKAGEIPYTEYILETSYRHDRPG